MILPPLHLASLLDEFRYNMALISIENGVATTTNGHMVVKIELAKTTQLSEEQIKILDGKFIHMTAWKEIHNTEIVDFTDSEIVCKNKGIEKIYSYANPQGEFFSIKSLISEAVVSGSEAKSFISFNHKYLSIIGKIFKACTGSDNLVFNFNAGSKGAFITAYYESGVFAYLMPVFLENGQDSKYIIN
jgi:hypothetical protein